MAITSSDKDRIVALATGTAEARTGMEKHFLRVLSGSALACSPVEKEWLAFYERWRSVQGDEQPEHAYEDDDYGALDDETAETMREIVEESLEYADGYARSDDEGWFYSDD